MYASHVCVFPYSLLSARCSQTSERTAHSSEMRTGEPASNNRQETTDTMGRAGKRNEKLRAASAHSDRSVYGVKTITDQCIGTVKDTTLAANHGGDDIFVSAFVLSARSRNKRAAKLVESTPSALFLRV
jgi:hypothetical protein